MTDLGKAELIDELAQKVWAYHHLDHKLEKSECILVLGSNDPRVARRGAELFLAGWAPLLVCSGHVGVLTAGLYSKPEAEYFAEIAVSMGVPRQAILVENRSRNTGENIQFSRALLQEQGIDPASFIVVQKPYMERRAFATFKKFWPEKKLIVTSPQISFADYPFPGLPKELVINLMVGDLQRIKIYPARGFQIEQEIPPEIWDAYEQLVALGFDQHLAK